MFRSSASCDEVPAPFFVNRHLPADLVFSAEMTTRTAIAARGRKMATFSALAWLALLSVMVLLILAQPARATCEDAEEGDPVSSMRRSVAAGTRLVNHVLPARESFHIAGCTNERTT